jgi:hypothetical protein
MSLNLKSKLYKNCSVGNSTFTGCEYGVEYCNVINSLFTLVVIFLSTKNGTTPTICDELPKPD